MKNNTLKIGQEIVIKEDLEVKSSISERVLEVKKGDRGYVDSRGTIHYTTGKARGMFQKCDAEIKGFDHYNIAKMIFKRLDNMYNLEIFFDDEELDRDEFIDDIETVLMDIL